MTAATWVRDDPHAERLLFIDPRRGAYDDARVGDLGRFLRAGDLLVVNDAATLPASLRARLISRAHAGAPGVEVRLMAPGDARDDDAHRFDAVLFGAGDWRTPTEHRPPPPAVTPGDELHFAPDLVAHVERVSPLSPRLVTLRFTPVSDDPAALYSALYRVGRPVQYAYLRAPLELWHVQTRYAGRPWASELPSAGRPLTWSALLAAKRAGVRVAALTHAAGLSSTGDPAIDAALPLPERYEIPAETVDAVRATRAAGGRVIAVGTSVVRALEGCAVAHDGALVAGRGVTDLVIRAGHRLRVVDGLFTGIHEPTASHYSLLQAFAPLPVLTTAYAHAEQVGYLCHEFGDSNLILAA